MQKTYSHSMTLMKRVVKVEKGVEKFDFQESLTVLCDVKSVKRSEYYSSRRIGFHAELEVDMNEFEYDGEEYAYIDKKMYQVTRVYVSRDGLEVSLTLERRSQYEDQI